MFEAYVLSTGGGGGSHGNMKITILLIQKACRAYVHTYMLLLNYFDSMLFCGYYCSSLPMLKLLKARFNLITLLLLILTHFSFLFVCPAKNSKMSCNFIVAIMICYLYLYMFVFIRKILCQRHRTMIGMVWTYMQILRE